MIKASLCKWTWSGRVEAEDKVWVGILVSTTGAAMVAAAGKFGRKHQLEVSAALEGVDSNSRRKMLSNVMGAVRICLTALLPWD